MNISWCLHVHPRHCHLIKHWKRFFINSGKVSILENSNSSASTSKPNGNISILCTTATGVANVADAQSSKEFTLPTINEEEYGATISNKTISWILQVLSITVFLIFKTIWAVSPEGSLVLSSKARNSKYLVMMRIYPMNQLHHVDKTNWWKSRIQDLELFMETRWTTVWYCISVLIYNKYAIFL